MTAIDPKTTVGALVAERPSRSRLFEELGIDYCCGGKVPLEEACAGAGLEPVTVAKMLAALDQSAGEAPVAAPATMSPTELCDHIEETHHAYLRKELPRLDGLTAKVEAAHAERDPRLGELRTTFLHFAAEIDQHMMKEEQVLFPLIRRMESADGPVESLCGSIRNPIAQMEHEHDRAGDALARMRSLTDDFTPPEWACNTFRALLDALAGLELDTHQHVHKENNVLFPRALELDGR